MPRLSLAGLCMMIAGLGPMSAGAAPRAAEHPISPIEYHLTSGVRLGAPDRWDYVVYDAPSRRVYVAHGDRVTVVDGRSGSLLGEVEGIPGGTHGIAISHAGGLGYTDDGRAGEAVAFDLKTLKVVKRLEAAPGSDAITIDPVSGHVFVVDGDAGELTVIDPMSDRVVATIHVGSGLEYAVAGNNGKVYVNGVQTRDIVRIDTTSNRVDASWPIPQCLAPHGLAIDTATHRLFSSCENQRLIVINGDDGKVVATLPIGRGTDGAAFDSNRRLIFSSNGIDGTVTVIRELSANTFEPAGTIPTALSARTMSVDPASGRLFFAAAKTSAKALAAFYAARRAGRPASSPFSPGSLELLFFDPVR